MNSSDAVRAAGAVRVALVVGALFSTLLLVLGIYLTQADPSNWGDAGGDEPFDAVAEHDSRAVSVRADPVSESAEEDAQDSEVDGEASGSDAMSVVPFTSFGPGLARPITNAEPRAPEADVERPEAGASAAFAAGRLVDALNGDSIRGRVIATAYRGDSDPSHAGHPARYQRELELSPDGSFEIPVFDVEDPTLRVHLQVDADGYATETIVLSRREPLGGRWTIPDIELRRAGTVDVRVLRPSRAPLVRVPVRVIPVRGTHSTIDAPDVWIAPRARDRLVIDAEPRVQYTDGNGAIRLERTHYFYWLEVLHPLYRLAHEDKILKANYEGKILYHLPESGEPFVYAYPQATYEVQLVDSAGDALRDAEVVVDFRGIELRTRTDEDGRLVLGPKFPLVYSKPEDVTVRVEIPAFFRRGLSFKVPERTPRVVVPGRPLPRMRLRLVDGEKSEAAEEPSPVPPHGIELSHDLTLVRVTSAGEAKYVGAPPEPGETVVVACRGWLPGVLTMPAYTTVDEVIELGDVPLERGLSRTVVLSDVPRGALRGAELSFVRVEGVGYVHRYALDGERDRVTVSGLSENSLYDVAVVGPGVESYTGRFELKADEDADDPEPIALALRPTTDESVVVRGRIARGAGDELEGSRVIERIWVDGETRPRVYPSYALGADGSFGSRRRIRGAREARVTAISSGAKAVNVVQRRDAGPPLFDFGDLYLLPRARAEVTFVVEGVGAVDPPKFVALRGVDGIEEISRFRVFDRRLVVDNLAQGEYQLEWSSGDERRDAVRFRVDSAQEVEVTAKRSAFATERIEILLVDSSDMPIRHGRVDTKGGPEHPAPVIISHHPPRAPGTVLAVIRTRERNEIRVRAPQFVDATIVTEPGEVIPTKVQLPRPVNVRGRLIDVDGHPVRGAVQVSWEPEEPRAISYGAPIDLEIRSGRFHGVPLPALPLLFTFRLADSAVSVTRRYSLPESESEIDLGDIELRESRSISGTVFFPDGTPAPGAAVAVIREELAGRFPLKEPLDFARERFKAVSDAEGRFRVDALPIDLDPSYVLVARLAGYGDRISVLAADPSDSQYELVLDFAATLALEVGYLEGGDRSGFRFSLEYQRDARDPSSRFELGEIAASAFGVNRFVGIEPGIYRVRWGLEDAYDAIPPVTEEVLVEAGLESALALVLEGRELRGRARRNGVPVRDGWILLTDTPSIESGTRVGRVVDGEFLMIDPPTGASVYGAVIEKSQPQTIQNIYRGEAIPIRVRSYPTALRTGDLHFDYAAHDLTVKFATDFLTRYPGAYLTFQHYEWTGRHFRAFKAEEAIEGPLVHLRSLLPGVHHFSVRRARGGLISTQAVDLTEQDRTVRIGAR